MEDLQNNGENQPAKRSTTETGHAVNLSNFNLLIKMVKRLEENYQPSNPALTTEALDAIYNSARADLNSCVLTEATFDRVTGMRAGVFTRMKDTSGKAHRSFKASNASAADKDDAQTIMYKLRGRVSQLRKGAIISESEASQKHISNSQQSYTQLIEHFRKLRGLLSIHPRL